MLKRKCPISFLWPWGFPKAAWLGDKIHKKLVYHIPVVFILSRNDLSWQIETFRAGTLGDRCKHVAREALQVQLERLANHRFFHAKILVVDDDTYITEALTAMFESQCFYCITSNNPANVIHLLERHSPDILLFGTNMMATVLCRSCSRKLNI